MIASPAPCRPSPLTLLAILAGNLIPIAGVLWFGWNAAQVLLLYWIETFIVGVVTYQRIRTAQGGTGHVNRDSHPAGRPEGFFVMHYGIFWLVHGVFVVIMLFMFGDVGGPGAVWRATFGNGGFWLAAAGMALTHAVVFWREWVRPRAWMTADPEMELFRPYGRVFALHIVVVAGFWLLLKFGGGAVGLIILLCAAKALVELVIEIIPKRPVRE